MCELALIYRTFSRCLQICCGEKCLDQVLLECQVFGSLQRELSFILSVLPSVHKRILRQKTISLPSFSFVFFPIVNSIVWLEKLMQSVFCFWKELLHFVIFLSSLACQHVALLTYYSQLLLAIDGSILSLIDGTYFITIKLPILYCRHSVVPDADIY